jgi:Ni2+-binding GTPase involved in maturation of urease and hydrogenase
MKVIKVTGKLGVGKTRFIEDTIGAQPIEDVKCCMLYEKDGVIYIDSNEEVEFLTLNIEKK